MVEEHMHKSMRRPPDEICYRIYVKIWLNMRNLLAQYKCWLKRATLQNLRTNRFRHTEKSLR